jgi:hypothetical protein
VLQRHPDLVRVDAGQVGPDAQASYDGVIGQFPV